MYILYFILTCCVAIYFVFYLCPSLLDWWVTRESRAAQFARRFDRLVNTGGEARMVLSRAYHVELYSWLSSARSEYRVAEYPAESLWLAVDTITEEVKGAYDALTNRGWVLKLQYAETLQY